VNLLPEVSVRVDLMMLGRCSGETFVGGAGSFVEFDASASAFRSETNEFHKRLSVFEVDCSKSARNEEHLPKLLAAASLQLPSRLQVNLEIAQAVSQRRLSLSTTLYPGQKCVEASDDVIKSLYPTHTIVSNSFAADQTLRG
jgi:hypothetical protein